MEKNPEQLWKEAQNGSKEAWNELYALFGPKLYNFFLKNTSNADTAGDKCQEVFEKLYRSKDSFTGGSLKSWIFRIARNLLIDFWRNKGRKCDFFGDSPPPLPDPSVNVEESVLAKIQREEMVGLIDSTLPYLPEPDLLVIGLVYLGGLTISELGEVMEIPLGTAKTRVRQARLKLDRMIMEKIKDKGEVQEV